MATTKLNEEELRESLKRCPERAIEAAIQFNQTRDPDLVPAIVMGIIERFVEPDVRPVIREGNDQTRLLEDLGIDSLLMVEIVILVEETLGIHIENEELRNLRSLGDIKAYLDAKIKGLPIPSNKNVFKFEQIAATMPHQPPFLFLQEARINGMTAEGSYHITGDEAFLEGHFKDNPVFPASLMLEALGQLAVLFMLKTDNKVFGGSIKTDSIYFVSCDGVRCHKMCKPQDVLQLKVTLKKVHAPLAQFEGTILCHGTKVAKAEEISLTFDLESPESGQHPQ
jgi:3-hydroxyacyl-[acyl-carrier-protein] dehydratase